MLHRCSYCILNIYIYIYIDIYTHLCSVSCLVFFLLFSFLVFLRVFIFLFRYSIFKLKHMYDINQFSTAAKMPRACRRPPSWHSARGDQRHVLASCGHEYNLDKIRTALRLTYGDANRDDSRRRFSQAPSAAPTRSHRPMAFGSRTRRRPQGFLICAAVLLCHGADPAAKNNGGLKEMLARVCKKWGGAGLPCWFSRRWGSWRRRGSRRRRRGRGRRCCSPTKLVCKRG